MRRTLLQVNRNLQGMEINSGEEDEVGEEGKKKKCFLRVTERTGERF